MKQYEHNEHDGADAAWGDHEKRHDKFDGERARDGNLVKPERHVVRVPTERVGEGLRFVVVGERGQVAPGFVAELYVAGHEHEPEQQPAQQHQHHARMDLFAPDTGQEFHGGEEDREKGSLEEQRVPLKAEEVRRYETRDR